MSAAAPRLGAHRARDYFCAWDQDALREAMRASVPAAFRPRWCQKTGPKQSGAPTRAVEAVMVPGVPIGIQEIVAATGLSRATVGTVLWRMVDSGQARKTGLAKRDRRYIRVQEAG